MAESEHDDLADALARMAGGEVEPHEQASPPTPVTPRVIRPVSSRPAAPGSAVPPTPPAKPARPAAPALSSAPSQQPAAPPEIRRVRPTAPTLRKTEVVPTETVVDGGQSTGLANTSDDSQIIDDDDAVIVPAPEASVFLPKAKPITSADARAKIQKKKWLEYRRTLIPVLLTTGTMLMVFGILKFLAGPDSMLVNVPKSVPIVFLSLGVLLLVLAIINMLSVKHELAMDGQ